MDKKNIIKTLIKNNPNIEKEDIIEWINVYGVEEGHNGNKQRN